MSEGDNGNIIYSQLYSLNLTDFSQEMLEHFILTIIYKDYCLNNQILFTNTK